MVLENTAVDKRIDYDDGIDLGGIYILPQAKRQKFVIEYSLTNGSGSSTKTFDLSYVAADDATPDPVTGLSDVDKGWQAGHRYKYTIVIGSDASLSIHDVQDIGVNTFDDGNVGTTEIN